MFAEIGGVAVTELISEAPPVYASSTTPLDVTAEIFSEPLTAVTIKLWYVSSTTPAFVFAEIGGVAVTAVIPVPPPPLEVTVPATTRFPPMQTSPETY